MRAVLQRVSEARVQVAGEEIAQIGPGLMILACAMQGDTDQNAKALAEKIAALRIFRDPAGKTNKSLRDTEGSILLVSQFTLAADTARGNRPGFSAAAPAAEAERLYLLLAESLRELGFTVETGQFGAEMAVSLINDGPMTIMLER